MRHLVVGAALALVAVAARAETPRPDYRALYQRGALRGSTPLQRYREQLRRGAAGSKVEIKPVAPIYQSSLQVGGRVTVAYGERGAQIDHHARVLEIDQAAQRVKVRALMRGASGLSRVERWVPMRDLETANVSERWPDGTRVLSGPPSDDLMASMVIDRRHDPELRRFLDREVAPLGQRHAGDPLALVDAVAKLVADKIRYNMDTDVEVEGREVLLGDYLRLGVGVCRNYAAITKVALDELAVPGLQVRYVSGQARDRHAFERGRHAWLEVTLPNGRRYGIDPTWSTWMTPLARFYADHLHVPLYQLRALHIDEEANPTVPRDAEPRLLSRSEDRTVGWNANGYTAPGRPRTAGWRLPAGALVRGRKLVYRFAAEPLAVDATAEILDVDERGGRVKIRASERGVKVERARNGKLEETGLTKRTERWVPIDGVRAALEAWDGGAPDPAFQPIAASRESSQRKIMRAILRVRRRSSDPDPNAAAIAALRALAIPGLELRPVSGTRFGRDLIADGPGEWLEVEFVENGQLVRLGADAKTGRVAPLERFYGLHRYAPSYEQLRSGE